jgi:hypothetical protein
LGTPGYGTVFTRIGGREFRRNAGCIKNQFGVSKPGDRGSAAQVENSRMRGLGKVDTARGEERRIGRRGEMVLHHADRFVLTREAKHQFQEVAAVGVHTGRAEDAGGAQDQRIRQIGLGIQLAS